MELNRECPLCGKEISNDGDEICEECRSYADNQYRTDFIGNSNSSIDDSEVKEENISKTNLEDINTSNTSKNETSNRRTNNISKTLLFLLVGCVVIVILGIWGVYNVVDARKLGETEEVYWDLCAEENTSTSYSKYLVRFPNGKYEMLAHQKIEELRTKDIHEWETLNKSSDIDDYFLFILNNPNSIYLDTIKTKIDSIAWKNTVSEGSKEAYKNYLEKSKSGTYNGTYANDAKYRYDYLDQIKILSPSASDSLRYELNNFYLAMSSLDKVLLNKYLDSTLVYFNKTINKTILIDSLKHLTKVNNIENVQYQLSDSLSNVYVDNKNIVFVELTINKITKSKVIAKPSKKKSKLKVNTTIQKDTLQIRINKLHKIISINKLKDTSVFN